MIETGKQTKEAIKEIMSLTEWSGAVVGRKLGLSRATISTILLGTTKNPSEEIMKRVHKELIRVRKVHG